MKSSLLSATDSCMGLMKQVNHILSFVPAEIRAGESVQEHQVKTIHSHFLTYSLAEKSPDIMKYMHLHPRVYHSTQVS